MGEHSAIEDEEVNLLMVAIVPLPGSQFYHYGTSREMISSTLPIQNLVANQRETFRKENWASLAKNHKRSVFYQLNLQHAADEFTAQNIELPFPLTEDDQLI